MLHLQYLTLNLSKEPNFILIFLVKSYTTLIRPNFIGKAAQDNYIILTKAWFQNQTSSFNSYILSHSQLQCDMLLRRSFGIIDLKTQRMGCGDSQPEGCDFGAVT